MYEYMGEYGNDESDIGGVFKITNLGWNYQSMGEYGNDESNIGGVFKITNLGTR